MIATRIATASEMTAAMCAFSLSPPSRMNSVISGIRANSELYNSESLTGSRTCLYIDVSSPEVSGSLNTPIFGGLVLGTARAVARTRLVARLAAAVPEHVVHHCGRRVAVGGDEQLNGVQRARADLDLLRRVVLEQLLRRDPRDQLGVELEHAVEPQDVRDEVVGEQRQPVQVVRRRESRQRQVGGGDLRALEQRHLEAVIGGHVAPRGDAGED